jgi:hypothetical protein
MRTKLNLEGSNRRVVEKLGMSQMPVEWLDAGSWRLPSGKALAEFALQSGFLAPLAFQVERSGSRRQRSLPVLAMSGAKHVGIGKGSNR